ncbi:MAG: ATP synthase F1 subunit delta [Bacteroidales bacterium]
MKNLRVANRYAKALLGLAEENDFSDQAFNDMKLVYDVFAKSKELKTVMKSPIVRISKKLNIINSVFKDKVHPVTLHYLNIITRKKRAALIEGIAWEFQKIHKENLDIETVNLITAGSIDKSLEKKAHEISKKLTKKTNIEFNRQVDPGLIGGFVLRVGDMQYDASVKRKLARLRKHLMEQ